MAITGFEIAAASRLLAPVVKDIYEGAKGSLATAFKKWNTASFPRKLAQRIASTDKIKTIWSPDKDTSLLSFYYPSHIIVDSREKPKKIEKINDLGEGCWVIEGIVGQGKSIFLRYLCLQEMAGNGSGRIPVFLEFRTLIPGKDLRHYIYQALEKLYLKIDDKVFDYLADSGKIVLLLDGFDELDSKLIKEAITELEFLAEKYENLQIIITSRLDNEIQKSRLFKVVKIAHLTSNDFPGFLKKLNLSIVRIDDIINAIKKSPSNVIELVNTPLMLTLLVMVYESEKEIPSELPEFFEKLFHVVFTKHDKLKAGFNRHHYTGLSERKLLELFEAFCFMVMQNEFGRSLTLDKFKEAFSQAIDYTSDCNCDLENFREDITKVACLMLEEGFNITTFLHKSILEYYAAAFIKRSSDEVAEVFYDEAIINYRYWEEVLQFLKKIDSLRHSKHITMPASKNMLDIIEDLKLDSEPEIFCNQFDKIFPGMAVCYAPEAIDNMSKADQLLFEPKNSDVFTSTSYGPFKIIKLPIADLGDILDHHIIRGLEEVFPEKIKWSEIYERLELYNLVHRPTYEYEITVLNGEKNYSIKGLINQLKNFEQMVKTQLTGAENMINNEKKKKLIFSKKK